MKNKNKYPEHIMKVLRQRLGLEADDTSRDNEINTYSPNEALEEVLTWEGICGYGSIIIWWIESIYGIDLDTLSTEEEEDCDEDVYNQLLHEAIESEFAEGKYDYDYEDCTYGYDECNNDCGDCNPDFCNNSH